MYDLRAIANYFIERGLNENVEISPMKLQKLMFFAYGLYLVSKDQPLFSDRFEVWPYGPVISQLYHTLKGYGNQSINRPISGLDLKTLETITPKIDTEDKELNDFLIAFWNKYKGYGAIQLSNATHAVGTPWKLAFDNNESIINDDRMREYFKDWVK